MSTSNIQLKNNVQHSEYLSKKVPEQITKQDNKDVDNAVTRETLALDPNAAIGYSLVQMGKKEKNKTELLRGINEVLKSRGEKEIPLLFFSKGYQKSSHYSDKDISDFNARLSLATDMLDAGFSKDNIYEITPGVNAENEKVVRQVLDDKDIDCSRFADMLDNINEENINLVKEFIKDSSVDVSRLGFVTLNNENVDIVRMLLNRYDIPCNLFGNIADHTTKDNLDFAKQIFTTDNISPQLGDNILFSSYGKDIDTVKLQHKLFNELLKDPDFDISRFDKNNKADSMYRYFNNIDKDTYEKTKAEIYNQYKYLPEPEVESNDIKNKNLGNNNCSKNSNFTVDSEYFSEDMDGVDESELKCFPLGFPVYISHKIKDKEGNLINAQIYSESDIVGEYEIWQENLDGTQSLIGLAERDENGGVHVEKHLTSLDGTITDIVYADDVKGNSFLHEKITDNTGKVLTKFTKQRKQISDNHYQTALNGQWTDVQVTDDKFVITKLDKNNQPTSEQIVYTIKDFSEEERETLEDQMKKLKNITSVEEMKSTTQKFLKKNNLENIIDKRFVNLLKKIPGEELINLANSGTKLVYNSNIEGRFNGISAAGFVCCGDRALDKISTFEHELGHEKFAHLNLHEDKELKKLYDEEKALFKETFSKHDIETIDYFLEHEAQEHRGLNETTAETNALLNSHIDSKMIQGRATLLQQYFPRTIAYLSKKLLTVN